MWDRLVSFARGLVGPTDPREAFAARVKRRMHATMPQRVEKELKEDFAFEVRHPDGKVSTMFLGNLFAETADLPPEELDQRIDHFLRSVADMSHEETWAEARELILPVIRGTAFGAMTRQPMLKRPLLPFLDVYFAIDRPTSTAFVPASKLSEWEVDEDTFLAVVDERLEALGPPRVDLLDGVGRAVHVVQAEDGHPPTRLLKPGFLRGFARRVEGRPLACFPTRDVLFITGDADHDGIRFVQEEAKKLWEGSPRRISPVFYAVDENDKLIVYPLPGEGVDAQDDHLLHLLLADFEYGEAKKRFEDSDDPMAQEVFMASFQAFRGDDGSSSSRAIWSAGVPTWLPHTDKVMLCRGEVGGELQWAVEVPFESLLPKLRPVPDTEPPRFAVPDTFPSKEQALAMAGARLVPPGRG